MMKLTVALFAVVLAGTASAGGWRDLKVDGTSEASFAESMATFEKKLSPSRRFAFTLALQEIWLQGTKKANAEQRTYTTSDYLQQLNGLGYNEVVRLPDESGAAEERYRRQFYAGYRLENGTSTVASLSNPTDAFGSPLGHFPADPPPPRETGQSRFRPMGGEPGINPWQNR